MSHDSEAAYAYSEIAGLMQQNANSFFGTIGNGGSWTLSAGREGGNAWPLADGVIFASNSKSNANSNYDKNIAFEFKRVNESVHGVLTAIGQAFAYIEKGYDASVICIPEKYSSLLDPGTRVRDIIDASAPNVPIVVYVYSDPDLAAKRPFLGKLRCTRSVDLSKCTTYAQATKKKITNSFSTVWAHVREGESFPDAFFRYCQSAKIISSTDEDKNKFSIIKELTDAVQRIKPGADPIYYLSSTSGDGMLEKAWRSTWYNFYLTNELMPLFKSSNPYVINDEPTKILKNQGEFQRLFSGRKDSIKAKIINRLNATPQAITLDEAWNMYAVKIHDTAHSYREDIDSGLNQLGFIDADGMLTDLGYRFVNECEKANGVYAEVPMNILRYATLTIGQYDVFLSTIYKYSSERFASNFYAHSIRTKTGSYTFKSDRYLSWLSDIFVNQLHMMKTATLRAGGTRKPFQAEIAYLKNLGLVDKDTPFKVGTGLNINWPAFIGSLSATETT